MHIRLRILLAALACGPLASCGVRLVKIIAHDEQAAAKSAARFADLAFVRSDYAHAQTMLAPQVQQAVPVEQLTAEVERMHPKARPSSVSATDFEPMPGRQAMTIYLKGKAGDEEFFYLLVMVGDKDSEYEVGSFARRSEPYPPSARRPL